MPRLDVAARSGGSGGYHGLVDEDKLIVDVTPKIRALGAEICAFRIVNKHHGETPFEVWFFLSSFCWRCYISSFVYKRLSRENKIFLLQRRRSFFFYSAQISIQQACLVGFLPILRYPVMQWCDKVPQLTDGLRCRPRRDTKCNQ